MGEKNEMKKAQEEISIISAMLIPVLVFLLLLIILYVNFLPLINVYSIVLLFAHDIGVLTESAYGTPGDVQFVYTGPISCKPVYSINAMNCTMGGTVITLFFDNPTYRIHREDYFFDVSEQVSYNKSMPGLSFVNISFHALVKGFTGGVTRLPSSGREFVPYPSEPSIQDILVEEFPHVLRTGGVSVQKQQKNFFGTLSLTQQDTSTIADLLNELIVFCYSDKLTNTFNMTYLPGYSPMVYSRDVDYYSRQNLPLISPSQTSDIFCIRKFSSWYPFGDSNWLNYECFDFSKNFGSGREVACEVELDVTMWYCDEVDGEDYCFFDMVGEADIMGNEVMNLLNHLGVYTQQITMVKGSGGVGKISLSSKYGDLTE